MAELRGIIFDMDGVITDTEPLHARAELLVCREHGCDPAPEEWEKLKGKTSDDVFRQLFASRGVPVPPVGDLIARKTEKYSAIAVSEGFPQVPGAVAFIRWARTRFEKIALATSSHAAIQRLVFDSLALHPFFDAVVTGDELRRGKPDPEAYLKAAAKMGLVPGDCLVVEDSDNGIRAARAAGCRVCGLTTSFPRERLLAFGAHLVVDRFTDLQKILSDKL